MNGRLGALQLIKTGGLLALVGCLLGLQACHSPRQDAQARLDALTTPEPDALRQRAMRRLALASAYFEQNQSDAAMQEARAALQIDPTYPQAFSLIGLIHQRANASVLAQQSFEHALQLASQPPSTSADLADVQHNYGWFLCQQDRFDMAQTQLMQAIAQPNYRQAGKSWMALGVCQLRAGQKMQARGSFEAALALEPTNPVVRYQLAVLDWQNNDASRAQAMLGALNSSTQASAESLWLGIQLARALAQPQEQRRLTQQLNQSFPNSTQALALAQGKFQDQ
ncbi:type IV pilus biogenesis/stability protein PilW [Limnohabitans sp.]|uniref:type IV pilus biogenesis/stability protein PilW n=1 Tax=Limnohabitans sp. TaxID=1907725 RepID=UPI00286EEC6C|nr:type IV pilus biogenesis/stability protein PilW [Limnohabitans sp.]